jgi:hypothetical protein
MDGIVEEYTIPYAVMPKAKVIAGVPDDDPNAALCYALASGEAIEMGRLIGAVVDTDRCYYFLEGFAAP